MAAIEHKGEVVFLHELRPGGADRSYGIHVAQIAGIPRSVTKRAGELLRQLEQGHVANKLPVQQSSLFDAPPAEPHPVVESLRQLNPNELTPIEALTRLYALVKQAHDE
jgi:DNA mismatch repair protein MutS